MAVALQTTMVGLPGAAAEADRRDGAALPAPAPGSRELAVLLMRVRAAGLPVVGVGHRYGPRVPRLRAPRIAAADHGRLTPEALEADAAAVAQARWYWARASSPAPAIPVDDANLHERARGPAACVPLRRWQPLRHASLCMGASAARHLDGFADERIGDLYNMRGAAPGGARSGADSRPFRDLAAIVRRGDACWAQLGAWPWAAFPDAPLPATWWTTDTAWSSLRALLGRELAAAHAGTARADGLRSAA